jgi:hypothetical protein
MAACREVAFPICFRFAAAATAALPAAFSADTIVVVPTVATSTAKTIARLRTNSPFLSVGRRNWRPRSESVRRRLGCVGDLAHLRLRRRTNGGEQTFSRFRIYVRAEPFSPWIMGAFAASAPEVITAAIRTRTPLSPRGKLHTSYFAGLRSRHKIAHRGAMPDSPLNETAGRSDG